MSDSENYQHVGAYPTVSSEKWMQHTIRKLSKGYLLIISNTRNYANFYRGGESFESCSYRTAKKLLRAGYLEESGQHMLGTIYQLKEAFRYEPVVAPKKPVVEKLIPSMDVDEELTELVVDIDADTESVDEDFSGTDFLLEEGDDADDFNSLTD